MRRLKPRTKDRRKVPIPDDLRESLRKVTELIQSAKNDPDVVLDHDDAIQVGAVCGGRFGKKPRPYVLTYFPKGDHVRGRWVITLHHTEIQDIGDGRISDITLYCCTSPDCRCMFREADEHCFHCDYPDDPSFGTFVFPAAQATLSQRGIAGVFEDSKKDDVVAALGPPDESGGGSKQPPLGYIWPWIKYRRADCQIRFEFDKGGTRIRNVTVLDKDWEHGK